MKRKPVGNWGLRIAGWILAGMGAVWLVLGAAFLTVLADVPTDGEHDAWVIGVVLSSIGAPMLLIDRAKRKRTLRLMQEGISYDGEILNAYFTGVRVNHQPGIVVECRYTDNAGATHLVKSDPQWRMPLMGALENYRARIWVDPYDDKRYYVEVVSAGMLEGRFDYDDR